MKAYKKTQQGASIWNCITGSALIMYIISYVDDNSIVRHFKRHTTTNEMIREMQNNLCEWQKLLQITGGDLCIDKCKITIMKWKQDGAWGRLKLESMKENERHIEIRSIKNNEKKEYLERLDPNHAERVLGIRLPLTGEMTEELQYRKKNLRQFCQKLYNSPISNYETHIAYQSRYKAISRYPYTVTTFSSKELNEIQKNSMMLLLPKMGINRNMPRCVIYGPRLLGGRQLIDQLIEQPVTNIKTTMGHLRREDNIASALNSTLIDTQIEIGTATPFYTLDPKLYGYGTKNTRWDYTWGIVKETNLRMEINSMWVPRSEFENDKCIMDAAVRDRHYQGKNSYKLVSINQCRMYQQAFFISDICDKHNIVKKDYLDGTYQHIHKHIKFPSMFKPTMLQWREWKAFIFRNFLVGQYNVMPPLAQKKNMAKKEKSNEVEELRMDNTIHKSIKAIIAALPATIQQSLGSINHEENSIKLVQAINEDKLFGSCDGSLISEGARHWGSHAYTIRSWDNDEGKLTGSATTPRSTTMTSLTSEIYGLLSTTTTLLYCFTKHHKNEILNEKTVTIFCDNEQAVKMCNDKKKP